MTIFVEREGQKAIIIGSRGAMLKKIGHPSAPTSSTCSGESFSELFVKVRENWRESPEFLTQLSWRA